MHAAVINAEIRNLHGRSAGNASKPNKRSRMRCRICITFYRRTSAVTDRLMMWKSSHGWKYPRMSA